ncbi:MAG: DUF4189 domain-containing protein [Reyranella sp.]|nr:DUF4189 domain-containing protein [Reyranella sp.]MDP3158999.1 DUF4189 domain-containing protein [Reyranella sp.]
MIRLLSLPALFLALFAAAAAAQTKPPAAPQYWVTYAYDAATGAWGLGWGKTDRQATINDALSRCAKPGCKAGDVTLGRCIASAQGTQKGVWFGTGNDAETAKGNALRFCRAGPAGSTCEALAVRCAG